MLAYLTPIRSIPLSSARIGIPPGFEPNASNSGARLEGAPLPALADEITNDRFRSWRGISGERYIFSVYDSQHCPAYCDAVVIAVVVDKGGARCPVAFVETGNFPEPVLSQLRRSCAPSAWALEFHVHLLAKTAEERGSILEDLRAAA